MDYICVIQIHRLCSSRTLHRTTPFPLTSLWLVGRERVLEFSFIVDQHLRTMQMWVGIKLYGYLISSTFFWLKNINFSLIMTQIHHNNTCRNKAEISSLFIVDRPFKEKLQHSYFERRMIHSFLVYSPGRGEPVFSYPIFSVFSSSRSLSLG